MNRFKPNQFLFFVEYSFQHPNEIDSYILIILLIKYNNNKIYKVYFKHINSFRRSMNYTECH